MLTLGSLADGEHGLELAFVRSQDATAHRETTVTGLTTLTPAEVLGGHADRTRSGHMVFLAGLLPYGNRGRTATAVQELLHQMRSDGCAALVISARHDDLPPYPRHLYDLSRQLAIPLLVTTAAQEHWIRVSETMQQELVTRAERRASQLNMLIQQLPAHLADAQAMGRITDWLARTLDAQVLVSERERVLAASPASAAERVAHAIIHQSAEAGHADASVAHTQLISLGPAAGAEAVLAVARHSSFDASDQRLLRHAAKVIGLMAQARHEFRANHGASHAARTAAAELLLTGELDKARRVMAMLAPGLLAPDTARVYVIQTTAELRDSVVHQCEAAMADRALTIADPRDPSRVLIINPLLPGGVGDTSVAGDLMRVMTTGGRGRVLSLGGSGVYSMTLMAQALNEALTAQRFATAQPDSVVLSSQDDALISLLPQHDAQAWARDLLRPLTSSPADWEQFRHTLPTALAYPNTVAAQRLLLHRNTVTRRVTKAAALLAMDLNKVAHRIAVGLALELVTQRDTTDDEDASRSDPDVRTLDGLLATPGLETWADTLLHPAREDRRPLLTTAAHWLAHDLRIESTAAALGLSDATVRSHLRALERHLSRDLTSLSGLRDLMFALHITMTIPEATAPNAVPHAA
ncbi:PucR family transcriptional regulator [Streptomyces montanus]|uniref:PucR family transcriptional regulator n=1 Tax=Streptomyces montanus TaxID=2580423 RepID=A0A5R9FQB8_9ACTN|nr:helix-turn-helix domain-containing protein [Streptomyces montanus]TLS46112.1 PucR family transcriptional regulator [Streptomyces montanus]